jgi:putative iron-regulated protein
MKLLSRYAFLAAQFICFSAFAGIDPIESNAALKKAAGFAISNYTGVVAESYRMLRDSISNLRSGLHQLVKSPNEENLATARRLWKNSRDQYSRTEAFRFYGGPIDNAEDGPEAFLNAWPIDEGYIDSVRGAEGSGIVNKPKEFPDLSKAVLLGLNEKNGEKNISTGYHAVEFLLWGQDFSTTGPGNRPASDFLSKTPNDAAARRGQYLITLIELMEKQVDGLSREWTGEKGSYAAALIKESSNEALRRIFTGITTLTLDEMAGERMTVPLEIQDQENEQDCFSDYTLNDFLSNQQGITLIVLTLKPLLELSDKSLSHKLLAKLEETRVALEALQQAGPFDQIVAPTGSKAAKQLARKAIAALEAQSAAMAASGRALGLELNVE